MRRILLINQSDLVLKILDFVLLLPVSLFLKLLQTILLSYKNKYSLAFESLLTMPSLHISGRITHRILLLKGEGIVDIILEGVTLLIGL